MRIKVCLIVPTLVQGGAEKQLTLLARNLDSAEFEVDVIVLTHTGPYESVLRDADIPLHFIGKKGKFDPLALRRLTAKLRQLKPTIVHTWLFAANAYGRWAARRAGVPVIVGGERSVDPWKRWWQFAIDRKLVAQTDTIVTNTSAVSDFYASHGIPASCFTVIPNAVVSPNVERLTREQLCSRLGIEQRGRIVGAVGRLWEQKGYKDLIWAAELLRVAHQDVWTVIVGDGPELERLQYYRDKFGAQDAVQFVGHRKDATELMTGFDVLWNGSLYEGQSNTILEAMSLGVPVVASRIPGNTDLVVGGETGELFELGDVNQLTRLTNAILREDDRRKRYGRNARARVEEFFSLGAMVESHRRLYHRLAAEKDSH